MKRDPFRGPSDDQPTPGMNPMHAFSIASMRCDHLLPYLALPRLLEELRTRTSLAELRAELRRAFATFFAHPHALRDPGEVLRENHGCFQLPLERQHLLHELADLVERWDAQDVPPPALRERARAYLLAAGCVEPYGGWDAAMGWEDDPREPDFEEVRAAVSRFLELALRLAAPLYYARWELPPAELRRQVLPALERVVTASRRIAGMNLGPSNPLRHAQDAAPHAERLRALMAHWPEQGAPSPELLEDIQRTARAYIVAQELLPSEHMVERFEGWDRGLPEE